MKLNGFIYLFFLSFLFFGCTKKKGEEHNFYFWKTTYNLNPTEQGALKKQASNRIYFRLCDIELGPDSKPHPTNVMLWQQSPDSNLTYIPVLFIENEVFEVLTSKSSNTIDKNLIAALAKNIYQLAKSSMHFVGKDFKEIQLDCDWTETTKPAYFYFLEELKKEAGAIQLSATIRLHQLKYSELTGIPPIDKGVLMCYNMGDMHNAKSRNSIFDVDMIEDYLPQKQTYNDIPLSFALPIYSWYLVYRNDQFRGIVRSLSPAELKENFSKKDDTHYTCTSNNLSSYKIQIGDILRFESITKKQLALGKKLLENNLPTWNGELIYFDLDSASLQTYEDKILE